MVRPPRQVGNGLETETPGFQAFIGCREKGCKRERDFKGERLLVWEREDD